MIDATDFARRQLELAAEFGKFVFDHPEVEENLPDGAQVFFEVEGEPEFNRFSLELADQRQREGAGPVVRVRLKGLAPASAWPKPKE